MVKSRIRNARLPYRPASKFCIRSSDDFLFMTIMVASYRAYRFGCMEAVESSSRGFSSKEKNQEMKTKQN